jgi:predicted kinase
MTNDQSLNHFLIGPPGSGKSTFATALLQLEPTASIVSTDQIRTELFGDESIQGDWSLIEERVLAQIREASRAGRPVIYDATNARREWRQSLLRQIEIGEENRQWLGWYLQTPLSICKAWNQGRKRQVPEVIIEESFQALQAQPPQPAEGFVAVNSVVLTPEGFELKQIERMLKKRSLC